MAVYREALKERTRERIPLDWAATQNNLGNALLSLSEREPGTTRLEEAVAAYKAALEVVSPENASYYNQMYQLNLAHAQALLDQRRAAQTQ